MADVKLRIEVNPDKESEFLNSIINDVGTISNASYKTNGSSAFVGLDNVNESGREMLSWANGVLRFTADGYLSNDGVNAGKLVSESEPDMFVWGAVPPSGEYSVKLTFKGTENLKDIIVYGDPTANQFPTEAIIDGKTTIYSDDYRWAINLGAESETHTIEFTKWNRPNYNACLTRIMVMMRYFPVDKKSGLKSVESLAQSTSQPDVIYYGVVPSSGSIEIVTISQELEDMIRDGVIPESNMPLQIFINDNQVQGHITTDSRYNSQTKLLNLELSNNFYNWDNMYYSGRSLTYSVSLYQILKDVLSEFKYDENLIDEMLDTNIYYGVENTYGSVKSYMEGIIIPYPFIEKDTLRNVIDKICGVAQLNVVEDSCGRIKFVSARPVYGINEKVIHIPSKCRNGVMERELILKNKISDASVNLYDYEKQEGTLVSSNNIEMSMDTGDVTYTNGVPKSIYKDAYNVEENNPYYQNTTVETKTILEPIYNADMELIYKEHEYEFYKTKLSFDISGFAIKDLSKLNVIVNGNTHGFYTISSGVGTGSVVSRDYKSQGYNISKNIADATSTINAKVFVENLVLNKKTISFDIFIPRERTFVSEAWLNATVSIFGEYYKKYEKESYENPTINNDLIQEGSTYNTTSMQHLLADNINIDYQDGIATATLSVICDDYYDTNGTLAINWAEQEILNIGDIVQVDKDNLGNSIVHYRSGEPMRFRITGRTFRKQGVPMLDLELQEVKLI